MGRATAKTFVFPLFMVQKYALTAHPQNFGLVLPLIWAAVTYQSHMRESQLKTLKINTQLYYNI